MPDPRWWNLEDARFNWSDVDIDRRDLGQMLVVDFMLVQGTDWFMVPLGHEVGGLVTVDQLLVRDVFGELHARRPGRRDAGRPPSRWSMFSTARGAGHGVAEYFMLPPSASARHGRRPGAGGGPLRPRRAGQPGLGDRGGRPRTPPVGPAPGVNAPSTTASGAPARDPTDAPLWYRLQTTVPVNWIPFVPVQVDAARRAVALQRGRHAAVHRRCVECRRSRPAGCCAPPDSPTPGGIWCTKRRFLVRARECCAAPAAPGGSTARPTCGPRAGARPGYGRSLERPALRRRRPLADVDLER